MPNRIRSSSAALRTLTSLFVASALLCLFSVDGSAQSIAYVQSASSVPQAPQTSVTLAYTAAQSAGDLNVVAVGWTGPTTHVLSVADSKGNTYVLAAGPTVSAGFAAQSIYYAKNVLAAAAGTNAVTVTFDAPASYPDLRIAEYKGIDPVNALDVTAGAAGTAATSSSGAVTTTGANDLLVGANYVSTLT